MSLPWFAFNIKDYISDTMRLTTEAHGAYLLLILDYYESEGPSPDDDFILAAITKLPIEQWQKHRKVLSRFFEIRDGHWFHNRIETEMRDACAKHAANKENARAAALAMHAARRAKQGETKPKPSKSANSNAQAVRSAVPGALPEQCSEHVHLTINNNTTTTTAGAREREEVEPEEDLGTAIDPKFSLDPSQIALCTADGTSVEEVGQQLGLFIAYNMNNGSWSPNWINTWALWWQRHLEKRAKEAAKAKPRIEVNNKPYTPTDAEWDKAIARFSENKSLWSRQLGPDPDLPGCRAPPHILAKYKFREAS